MRIEHKFIIPLMLLAVSNAVTGFNSEYGLDYYIMYVGVFLLFSIFLYFKRFKNPKQSLSSFYLLISIISIWISPMTLNDITFFCISLALSRKSRKVYIGYAFIFIISIVITYSRDFVGVSRLSAQLAGIAIIFFTFEHFILKEKVLNKKQNIVNVDYFSVPINKDIVDIIQYRIKGYDWHEINDILELNVTDDRVRRKISEDMKKRGFQTKEAYVYWLTKEGIIKPFSLKSDKNNN